MAQMISGDKIRVGDELAVWFNDGSAVVKKLFPYTGSLLGLIGEGSQIACFAGCGVEMTLEAKNTYSVTYRAPQ
jgi:hypothetical protein